MVTGAKHVVGLLALLIMANASPLQGGQHNLALNRDFGFDEDHYDRDLVENGPLPEDRGQDHLERQTGKVGCPLPVGSFRRIPYEEWVRMVQTVSGVGP